MLTTIKKRIDRQSVAISAAIALLLIVAGCGTKKSVDDGHNVSVSAPAVPTPINSTPTYATDKPDEPVLNTETPAEKIVTYQQAETAFNEGRYSEASELFASYTSRKPENPWGFYMLGLSARKAGDTENAIIAFEGAIELDSLHAKSWLNLARANMDAGQPEEALDNLDEAIELSSESGTTLRLQGRAFHQLGQTDDAVYAYRQAIIFDTDDAWSINNLALVSIEQDQFDEAIPMLARAIEIKSNVALFHNNLGMALENTEQYRAAENAYRNALMADSSYEKAEANLARVEDVEGQGVEEPVDLKTLAESFSATVDGWIAEVLSIEERQIPIEAEVISSNTEETTESGTTESGTTESGTSGSFEF